MYFSDTHYLFYGRQWVLAPWVSTKKTIDSDGTPLIILYNHHSCSGVELHGSLDELVLAFTEPKSVDEVWEKSLEKLDWNQCSERTYFDCLSKLVMNSSLIEYGGEHIGNESTHSHSEKSEGVLQKLWKLFFFRMESIQLAKIFHNDHASVTHVGIPFVLSILFLLISVFFLLLYSNANSLYGYFSPPKSIEDIVILFSAYFVAKFLHELSHGLAAKYANIHVKSVGVSLVVLTPLPFVDVSESVVHPNMGARLLVVLAGIFSDFLLGICAVVVFLNSTSDSVQVLCANIVFVVAVSSLLFNGNPLLKFDAYYALSELLKFPNLYKLSRDYLTHLTAVLFKRNRRVDEPGVSDRTTVMILYGISSLFYSYFVVFVIFGYLLSFNEFLGYVYITLATLMMIFKPLFSKLSSYYFSDAYNYSKKRKVLIVSLGFFLSLLGFAFVPMPRYVSFYGVVDISNDAYVLSGSSGFVKNISSARGDDVGTDDLLLELENQLQSDKLELAKMNLKSIEATRLRNTDPKLLDVINNKADFYREQIEILSVESLGQYIYSESSGVWYPDYEIIIGAWIKKGDVVGKVIKEPKADGVIKLAVPRSLVDGIDSLLGKGVDDFVMSGDENRCSFNTQSSVKFSNLIPSEFSSALSSSGVVAQENGNAYLQTREPVYIYSSKVFCENTFLEGASVEYQQLLFSSSLYQYFIDYINRSKNAI